MLISALEWKKHVNMEMWEMEMSYSEVWSIIGPEEYVFTFYVFLLKPVFWVFITNLELIFPLFFPVSALYLFVTYRVPLKCLM